MKPKYRTIPLAVLLSVAAGPGFADPLECQGTIISPGDNVAQLLQVCGEPTSRDGIKWIYDRPGDLPVLVTVGNDEGVIMAIGDVNPALDSASEPLGDHP